MIRVFVADDHTIVRTGIRRLLATAGDIEVVAEAADGRAVLNQLESVACDLLLLDLSLPKVNGTEVLRRVKELKPELKVLILSMYAEEQYALRMLRAGAAGYLGKDRSEHELIAAIRAVASGQRYVTSAVAERDKTTSGDGAPHSALAAREHQVFTLLCEGRSVVEIAAELDITPSTVSNHLARIRQKLGVRTVGEIVSYAHRAGLID